MASFMKDCFSFIVPIMENPTLIGPRDIDAARHRYSSHFYERLDPMAWQKIIFIAVAALSHQDTFNCSSLV